MRSLIWLSTSISLKFYCVNNSRNRQIAIFTVGRYIYNHNNLENRFTSSKQERCVSISEDCYHQFDFNRMHKFTQVHVYVRRYSNFEQNK